MKPKVASTVVTRPLQELFDKKLLHDGEPLFFDYLTENGEKITFQGTLRPQGIQIGDEIYSPSYSAVHCIAMAGERKAVNGWLMWKTKDGRYLAELYASSIGISLSSGSSENITEKVYKYPERRDVVFILGAGTSYAGGAPLQKTILPIVLSDPGEELKNSRAFCSFEKFMRDNFAWDPALGYYPTLESVFGFLDYFVSQSESLNKGCPPAHVRTIRESLLRIIHYVINREMKGVSDVHHLFWNTIYQYNRNVTIITLNYDTLLESTFECMYPLNAYMDYCIPLMNYDYNERLGLPNWWINPREPIISWEGEYPVAVKMIKLHGGLNWRYCNCCNQVLLTPWDTGVDINYCESEFLHNENNGSSNPDSHHNCCPYCESSFHTLLIPPSHLKDLSHPVLSSLFSEASREIRKSKRIVFIGYSLPEADVHIKAILKKSLSPNAEIHVIDIKDSHEFTCTYRALSNNVTFINASFEDVVEDQRLMKKLLKAE
jgi:hypothetical protein